MPIARCPSCHQRFNFNVKDIEAWYRERWPSVPVGADVPEECPTCWAARNGTELSAADRLRPYTRDELSTIGNAPPARGRVCPGCHKVLPRFADLTPDMDSRIRRLSLEGQEILAMRELIAATGCSLLWAKEWVDHPTGPDLHEKSGPGPDCYYCGKALRTPLACQCIECGMDWHDKSRVVRLAEELARHVGHPAQDARTPCPAVDLAVIVADLNSVPIRGCDQMEKPIPVQSNQHNVVLLDRGRIAWDDRD